MANILGRFPTCLVGRQTKSSWNSTNTHGVGRPYFPRTTAEHQKKGTPLPSILRLLRNDVTSRQNRQDLQNREALADKSLSHPSDQKHVARCVASLLQRRV